MEQYEAFRTPELPDERNTQLPAESSQVPDSYSTMASLPYSWITDFQIIESFDSPSYQNRPPVHIHEAFELPPQPPQLYLSPEISLTYPHNDRLAPQYLIRNHTFSHPIYSPLHAIQSSANFSTSHQPFGGQKYLQETTSQYLSDQHSTPAIYPSALQHPPNGPSARLNPQFLPHAPMTALPLNSTQTPQYQQPPTVRVLSQLRFIVSERSLNTDLSTLTTPTTKRRFFQWCSRLCHRESCDG